MKEYHLRLYYLHRAVFLLLPFSTPWNHDLNDKLEDERVTMATMQSHPSLHNNLTLPTFSWLLINGFFGHCFAKTKSRNNEMSRK